MVRFATFVIVINAMVAPNTWAGERRQFARGAVHCRVAELRPTQMAAGYRRVAEKIGELEPLLNNPKKLNKYLMANPEPTVLGPGGGLYIIDHHHLAMALWKLGVEVTYCEPWADLSHLTSEEFWSQMKRRNWVYLYDENGNGPCSESLLPRSVGDLVDDPYRSLASAVRKAGGFAKTNIPFAEFMWADFFRPRVRIRSGDSGFSRAVNEALPLAHSAKARNLPGYLEEIK